MSTRTRPTPASKREIFLYRAAGWTVGVIAALVAVVLFGFLCRWILVPLFNFGYNLF
jgi:hypothetical protein